MWVVKVGGSLARDPVLAEWMSLFASLGRGRVVLVPGGGAFADLVREHQSRWRFPDVTAHTMALLAMAQYGWMLQSFSPALACATSCGSIHRALREDRVAVWLPFELTGELPAELASWDVTSDSLAAWLAARLPASRLFLIKACAMHDECSWEGYASAGIVDGSFPLYARGAPFAVDLLHKDDLERMRTLLEMSRAAA